MTCTHNVRLPCRVEAGDIVMVVESDKADMDVEAFDSGFLAKALYHTTLYYMIL
jgi:hypothetical protein